MRNGRILFGGLILLRIFHPAPLISAAPKIILPEANAFVSQKEYQQAIPGFESLLFDFPAFPEANKAYSSLPKNKPKAMEGGRLFLAAHPEADLAEECRKSYGFANHVKEMIA